MYNIHCSEELRKDVAGYRESKASEMRWGQDYVDGELEMVSEVAVRRAGILLSTEWKVRIELGP